MKMALVTVGGQRESWLTEVSDAYQRKIGFFLPFEVVRLKPSRLERASHEVKLQVESESILKAIGPEDVVILCDERGQALDSISFSKKLVNTLERGRPRVSIVIGGAFGVNEELRSRANWQWSLSPLVLNHHVAQVVALEQIFRGLSIWKNRPYHNE